MGAPTNPTFTQASFRFRNDNGSQTTATWSEALNTNSIKKPYTIFRLRFLIQQTTSAANQNLTRAYKLKYSLNGGAYTDVGAQSSATLIRYANSSNITDNETTTQQLGTGSFVAGNVDENGSSASVTYTNAALSESEMEFVLEIYGGLFNPFDYVDLRVYETSPVNDTALDVYTSTPRLTRKRRFMILK